MSIYLNTNSVLMSVQIEACTDCINRKEFVTMAIKNRKQMDCVLPFDNLIRVFHCIL